MREFKASTMPECKKRARKRALQKACATRKTYDLDTAWWRGNSRVKLAKTTSYIQYRLIQQSQRSPPHTPPLAIATLSLHILLMGAWEVILASHAPKR